MIRTSRSRPLRIDNVAAPGGGQIGMTLCPGRCDTLSAEGAWQRDLYADIDAVRAWGPQLVVTLVEQHEYALPGVERLVEVVSALPATRQFQWTFLPIRDAGVPDAAFEEGWRRTGAAARNILRARGRILLHCRAGLGRTGMIAARLLAELGMPPDDAIRNVRAARSQHAIETTAQVEHVRSCSVAPSDVASDPVDSEAAGFADRCLGMFLGGAIGDALGAAFEFMSSEEIERHLGAPAVWDFQPAHPRSLMPHHPPGLPTDDTAMALALAAALEDGLEPAAVHAKLYALLRRGTPIGDMYANGAPGGACNRMLQLASDGAGPFEGIDPNAGGNGAAMRAHVCGIFSDRATVADVAAMQARLSHGHLAAVASAQVVALLAHEALHRGRLSSVLPKEVTDPTMRAAWDAAHADLTLADRLPRQLRNVDMAGWNTVAAAHAIATMFCDEPVRALALAAASGGDTDTVASIVGSMLGATRGWTWIPTRWIAGLQHRELVTEAARAARVPGRGV